ncbi:MAG: sulfite oxidase-like oxidoreductase [Deltaproteobacteria bacterium]|nr:sulfite oxidase-like oxidoreductase [Deltaproteobacteria bacterium]
MDSVDKAIRNKARLLDKLKDKAGRIGQNRLPPGQTLVRDFPVLDLGIRPAFDPATWRFEVEGEVTHPFSLSWEEFRALPRTEQVSDFHCVTTWSQYDIRWAGVKLSVLLDKAGVKPTATHLIQECGDGYDTNVPLDELRGDDILLAYELEGKPLPLEHGGPLRMLVPQLYAWKSAKFLRRLVLLPKDRPGFWEQRGYHNHADPWTEERFG